MVTETRTTGQSVIPGDYWRQYHRSDIDVVPVRAAGSKVYDAGGREYIDCLLGSGPLILGHGHPAVLGALRERLEHGVQFYFLPPEAVTLAEEIVRAVLEAKSHTIVQGIAAEYWENFRAARAAEEAAAGASPAASKER